ncbi:glycosyltransferase family protein [Photobacterium leiognathi]|uniref:hypothetical protein n=1 Tax=Photobacterium leiognathi TaxID=553611 RepID=UPI0029811362|nr:hypothetical protein [Photobacterium leiognathi]
MNIIIDLIRKNNEHHVFNSETIKAIESITNESYYYLDGSSSSIEFIKNKDNLTNVKVSNTKVYLWILSIFKLIQLLFKHKKDNIIILSATPLHYFVCTILNNLLNVNIKIFMHGELGYINSAEGRGQKFGSKLLDLAFKIKSKIKFIAINEYIYNKMLSLYPETEFSCIEHPLQQYDLKNKQNKDDNFQLNIGSFGIQSKEKNSEKIYELSSIINDLKVKLQTIGITNGSFEYDQSSNVIHYCRGDFNSELIPKDVFLSYVLNLDLVLFFNSSDEKYDLIPSGVFSDCIALELPIIALKNAKLEFFFQKYGVLGILCDDIESMGEAIRKLYSNPAEYKSYKDSIKMIKSKLNFSRYRRKISELLK